MADPSPPTSPIGPQIVFGMDTDGICTLSVGSGLAGLGLEPGQLVGQNVLELYGQDPDALRSLTRVLHGETLTLEREYQGTLLWLYYQPVRDADGTVTGAYGIITDVTRQRAVEQEVREARERAGMLADLSTALTREVLDPEALLVTAVRAVTEAVAESGAIWLPAREAGPLEVRAVWPCAGADAVTSAHWVARAEQSGLPSDLVVAQELSAAQECGLDQGHCGLRLPMRSRGVLIGLVDVCRDAAGPFAPDELALAADIVERCALAIDNALLLQAQTRAHEDLVKFQALADASNNVIAITDPRGGPAYYNPLVESTGLLQFDQGEVWRSLADLAGEQLAEEIQRSVRAEGRWSGDVSIPIGPEGAVLRTEVFSLTHPVTGAPLGTAWIGEDVTELRSTEATLRAANADLKMFMALVETSPDFIAIAGLDGMVRYVNPLGRRLIGLDPDLDVTSTTIAHYLTPEGLRASLRVEQPAVVAHGHWEGESTLLNHRDKSGIPVAIASFLMTDPETAEPFALATVQRDITERLEAETTLRDLARQRQLLLSRLVDAQEVERTQIAADVHDDPVQALAAVELRLGLLRRQLHERAPDLMDTLGGLQTSVSGATDRLRALLFDLEPPDLDQGLAAALRRTAEELFSDTTTRCRIRCEEEPDLPDAIRAIAFRIAKEALVNARKHAAAATVEVGIGAVDGGVEVVVTDDGLGLGDSPVRSSPGHRGLFGMEDRAEAAGGRLELREADGGGTEVSLWLPGPRET